MKFQPKAPGRILSESIAQSILQLPTRYNTDYNVAIDFKDVSIRYGNRTILDKLNFTIKGGEKWALTGRNGSGKSTLLSIVCADNLQSYANQIVLFDKERGTGESIWEIKRNIGYVSPELHRSYYRDIPAIDIVASGLSDSIGLYMRPKPEQREICLFWMNVFGIKHLANTSFLQLSSGEQRLVLLSRAFVKDPSLLILDEPLHGLDSLNSRLVLDIVETFSKRKGKTLIVVSHYLEEIPECVDNVLTLGISQD
jgi:molybdate transport system ATP-binding protein